MADLQITITESVVINGANRGSTNTLTTTGIVDTLERTITCTHSQTTTIAEFGATPHAAASNIDRDNVKYIRVTNLDDTNECMLGVVSGASNYQVRLRAGASHLLYNGDDIFVAEEDTTPAFAAITADLASLQIRPCSSNDIQVEMFIASVQWPLN